MAHGRKSTASVTVQKRQSKSDVRMCDLENDEELYVFSVLPVKVQAWSDKREVI